MNPIKTLALCIQYDGSAYHGWQLQLSPKLPTVQGELQQALSKIANEPVTVICAGRTDSGVHASYQVVSFQTTVQRPLKAWVQGVNTHLPSSISVAWAREVDNNFHARFTAFGRRYQYFIRNHQARSALCAGRVTHQPRPLNAEAMHRAAQALLGENDFSSFRGSGCQSNSPFRCLTHISVTRQGDMVCIDVSANAFLLHMVRNIVGSLMDVGMGIQSEPWLAHLLAVKDRTQAGVTAPPDGLYLVGVDYPEHYGLPAASTLSLIT